MDGGDAGQIFEPLDFPARESLCIATSIPNLVLHNGSTGYQEEMRKRYGRAESVALEKLIKFKAALKASRDEHEFWPMATEVLAELTGAQYSFINKRMVVDDQDAAVEMPPIGEKGSCLMAQALYYNDGRGNIGNKRNVKYSAYGCPCEFMKHDKTFLIPERLNDFITDNPNELFVVPAEAYLGVPLMDRDGKCFAHFGVMWSAEALSKMELNWAFVEMLMHSLEDIFLSGFLDIGRFASAFQSMQNSNAIIPHEAITAAQSLKPYARSLSHELRTPMQGVVGMLDVMMATVQEAAEHQDDRSIRDVFDILKGNIETVQDSSRRAIEAADNVVHAYDMDMGLLDKPMSSADEKGGIPFGLRAEPELLERRSGILGAGEDISNTSRGQKRRRTSDENVIANAAKYRKTNQSPLHAQLAAKRPEDRPVQEPVLISAEEPISIPPGLRYTNVRHVLRFLVNDLLKVGGRPESAIVQERDCGEEIEVRVRNPNGDEKIKTVRWNVHPGVPDTILIDEQSLVKVISALYSNAIKFTPEGKIELHARPSVDSRYVQLSVTDGGTGIQEVFRPKLFRAFSREDASLTRHSEGLGLGLMVAKGLARKIGGDLTLVRTETTGPRRGSEFELRVPVAPGDSMSGPPSPSDSPEASGLISPARREEMPHAGSDSLRPLQPCSALANRSNARIQCPAEADEEVRTALHLQSVNLTGVTAKSAIPLGKVPSRRPSPLRRATFDRALSSKYPLTFLVVEDNQINRRLLVNMLSKLGYKPGRDVYEAYDGADAVRQVQIHRENSVQSRGERACIDVILMDIWMPFMDGYEATDKILGMSWDDGGDDASVAEIMTAAGDGFVGSDANGTTHSGARSWSKKPTVLAVTADVTDGALERAASVGMKGFLSKPFKLLDLEKLILTFCTARLSAN